MSEDSESVGEWASLTVKNDDSRIELHARRHVGFWRLSNGSTSRASRFLLLMARWQLSFGTITLDFFCGRITPEWPLFVPQPPLESQRSLLESIHPQGHQRAESLAQGSFQLPIWYHHLQIRRSQLFTCFPTSIITNLDRIAESPVSQRDDAPNNL
ncbi:hypothetical protein DENSPDRAFT_716311 [Dentipellis sp. KUC8613]|nr:hypothetical protein DENSPDRAFT_716311 [Dentipellis sp. KUC8613]